MTNNVEEFQRSITQELDSVKNRVRNLIGYANWGEEGRYKEVVLKNILRKFLPNNVSVGTGFILKSNGSNFNNISKQLDIIIYDNTLPVLFSEGDFIITTLTNVKGIIEVKSKVNNSTFQKAVKQFDNSIKNFATEIRSNSTRKIFLGIFAFEFTSDINSQDIDSILKSSKQLVNHISLGKKYFIRHWDQQDGQHLPVPVDCNHNFYNIYELNDLSFSYFISNVLDMVCGSLHDRYWFLYPIEETKEVYKNRTVCL